MSFVCIVEKLVVIDLRLSLLVSLIKISETFMQFKHVLGRRCPRIFIFNSCEITFLINAGYVSGFVTEALSGFIIETSSSNR